MISKGVSHAGLFLCLAAAFIVATVPGCASKKAEPKRAHTVTPNVRDVPGVLRNTVGAETALRGINSTLVSGYGFVVGLNGTGGLPMPESIAGTIERQMGLEGIGAGGGFDGTAIAGKTPRQLLADPNTAVVLVQAAIPPGARPGTTFDVYVRAVNATNLEGGRLWTTDLRLGDPASFGGPQRQVLSRARGPIFINPFAEPGAEMDGVTRDFGRILDGGVVTEELVVELILDNASHSRASVITSAINSRFPERSGDSGPTARGRDSEIIKVFIPARYADRPADFVQLVRHLQIDQAYSELHARRYAEALKSQPYLSSELSWCLEALGERSLPFLRKLYDYPEIGPRLAALRAGANLNDASTARHLAEIAETGPDKLRTDAIILLGRVDGGPTVERTLRGLLATQDLSTRVAAYEALALRAEAAQRRRLAARIGRNPAMTSSRLDALAHASFPAGTIQGVSRTIVEGKFLLDRVPVGEPLIYVTQQREPRIVIFGSEAELRRPLLAGMWSDRLMLTSDSQTDSVRIYFRDDATGRQIIQRVSHDLVDLIIFMAHDPTPESPRPGLGLSYSEVVGALYGIHEDAGTTAAFSTERDRLVAELVRAGDRGEVEIRPETPDDGERLVVFSDPQHPIIDRTQGRDGATSSLLVPLERPAPEGEEADAGGG